MGKIMRGADNLFPMPKGSFLRNKKYVYINTSNRYVAPEEKKTKGGRGYTDHESICIGVLQDPDHPEVRFFYGNEAYHAMREDRLPQERWGLPQSDAFEDQIAAQDLDLADALHLLDCGTYFDLCEIRVPAHQDEVGQCLLEDGILYRQENGLYAVSNLGALLFAKRLSAFPRVSRKAVRVIQYADNSRMDMLKDYTVDKGYAAGWDQINLYLDALIPSRLGIERAIREKRTAYPMQAVREAVVNALIHQDFTITGTGPMVESFYGRLEITNPGVPLTDGKRIIDQPAKARNERMAAMMRRMGLSGEPGSGWDDMVRACEAQHMLAPGITVYPEHTRVTFFSEMPFSDASPQDKLLSCYDHASILYLDGQHLTTRSLRDRFGLPQSSAGSITRLIRTAVQEGLIKPTPETVESKRVEYVPYWA